MEKHIKSLNPESLKAGLKMHKGKTKYVTNNVYLLSAVPQSQTGLTALYNEIKAGHNNELSKIKMNLK